MSDSGAERDAGPSKPTLFLQRREELTASRLQSFDALDRSLLALSSGGLALSVALVSTILETDAPAALPFLYFSWGAFVCTMVLTLLSFLTSVKAMDFELDRAEKYYLNDDEQALASENRWSSVTQWVSGIALGVFVLALTALLAFAVVNLSQENKMASKKNESGDSGSTSNQGRIVHQDGALPSATVAVGKTSAGVIPTKMVETGGSEKKGATPSKPVTAPPPTQQPAESGSGSSAEGTGNGSED